MFYLVRKLVSHGKWLRRSPFFWYVTQSRLEVSYRRMVRVMVIQVSSGSKTVLGSLDGADGLTPRVVGK